MRRSQRGPGVPPRARTIPLAFVAAAAVALAATAGHSAGAVLRGHGSSRPAELAHRGADGTFRIRGAVGGLYPGASTQLVLTVSNPQHFAIVVTSISTEVGKPKPGCAAGNLGVAAFAGKLTVKADGSAQVSVPVVLNHGAPDACQGAVFPLEYSGLARKA